jgi:hypothetical protein
VGHSGAAENVRQRPCIISGAAGGTPRGYSAKTLHSWSLVKMGTTANQRKLFFHLRKAKSKIFALDEGDMRPDQVELIAKRLGVTEHAVIAMNRRLAAAGTHRALQPSPLSESNVVLRGNRSSKKFCCPIGSKKAIQVRTKGALKE